MAGRGIRPNSSAMEVNNSLHGRQSHTAAGKFRRLVQALEYAEKRMGISHVEPHAVVPDKICGTRTVRCCSDFHHRFSLTYCKFYRVLHQVRKHNLEQPWISIRRNSRLDLESNPTVGMHGR